MLWGFAIPSNQAVAGISMEKGDYKSPGLIGRTFFTTDCKSVGTPNGGQSGTEEIHFIECA